MFKVNFGAGYASACMREDEKRVVFTFESMTEDVLQDGNEVNKLWR